LFEIYNDKACGLNLNVNGIPYSVVLYLRRFLLFDLGLNFSAGLICDSIGINYFSLLI
jgi:hypothetical protein